MTERKDPTGKKLEAKIVGKEEIVGGFLRLNKIFIEKDRHEGGKENITWTVMERGHAVGVLAYDPKRDEVVLVNEMRPGILCAGDYPYTDNLIAGGIGKNETAVEAGIRETMEEAGLELKDAVLVHPGAYVSSGGTSEKIAIVAGIVDTANAGGIYGLAEERENIKVTVLKADEFFRQIDTGEMNDLKTIVAGYWLKENRLDLQLKYSGAKQTLKAGETTEVLDGILTAFHDQGMDGVALCFYDESKNTPTHRSHAGLKNLKKGDVLTIFNDTSRKDILWQGEVDLEKVRKRAAGMLVTEVQRGAPADKWAQMFADEKPARLERKVNPAPKK